MISPRFTLLLAGVSVLAAGALSISNTCNFLARTVSAEGVVRQRSKSTLWVSTGPSASAHIAVRRPFSWPGAYPAGTPARIVYRPDHAEQPWVFPLDFLFPNSGRIATWHAIWLGPVALASLGALLVALCVLSFVFPRRLAVRLRFRVH